MPDRAQRNQTLIYNKEKKRLFADAFKQSTSPIQLMLFRFSDVNLSTDIYKSELTSVLCHFYHLEVIFFSELNSQQKFSSKQKFWFQQKFSFQQKFFSKHKFSHIIAVHRYASATTSSYCFAWLFVCYFLYSNFMVCILNDYYDLCSS